MDADRSGAYSRPASLEASRIRTSGRGAGSIARLDEGARPGEPEAGARIPDQAGLTPLERLHRAVLGRADERAAPLAEEALARALPVESGAGESPDAARLAATAYLGELVVELAAAGELDPADARIAVDHLCDVGGLDRDAAAFALHERVTSSAWSLDLPPAVAVETRLALPLALGVFASVSLWLRAGGSVERRLVLGADEHSRRAHATAAAALERRPALGLVGGGGLVGVPVERFGRPVGALVAQPGHQGAQRARAFLSVAAASLAPILEREQLLARSLDREHAATGGLERRLMTLAFDLHDGVIQDVLALGGELAVLCDDLLPFVDESHRALAAGRFADAVARLSEIDAGLRGLAHSLESRSVVARPLAEVLHREVETFGERTGIDARLEVEGDPESLASTQRIVVFRALHESLANVREHAGATSVRVRLRAGRQAVELRIVDNGSGFDVSPALARAAEAGRLGLVGMGERVRMAGGAFDVESRPGDGTTVTVALPWPTRSE